ncbi:uncharacterized protein LOC144152525 [Haemaphysalis longicornis]
MPHCLVGSSNASRKELPLNLFTSGGVNRVPVALVPANGASIRLNHPEAVQSALQCATQHYQSVTEVRQFGKGGLVCRSSDLSCISDLLNCRMFGSIPPAGLASMMRQMTGRFAEMTRMLGSALTAPTAGPVVPVSKPRLNIEVPSYFSYGDVKSVYECLQQLDSYQSAVGASDDDVLRQVLPVALVGSAARWRRCQPDFESMADFKDCFRVEFLPPDYERRMRDELAISTQHPEESLLEYVRAMQELYERADSAAADADKVARVCRQCHPRFRPYLRGQSFCNLEALAQEARVIQVDLLAELRYRLPPRSEESLEPGCAWSGGGDDNSSPLQAHRKLPVTPVLILGPPGRRFRQVKCRPACIDSCACSAIRRDSNSSCTNFEACSSNISERAA